MADPGLLYPDDEQLPPWLRQDPRAAALLATLQGGGNQPAAPIWNPNNPVGTETLQSMGMPKPTLQAGLLGEYINPATGQMTEKGRERMNNPALGLDTGGLGGAIKAYHGSPHSFDAFDASKIGTGEGAQAYGHGMYFAENEGVARGYRDQLSQDTRLLYQGNKVGYTRNETPAQAAVRNAGDYMMTRDVTAEEALKRVQRDFALAARDPGRKNADHMQAVSDAVSGIDPSHLSIERGGHMYEVNLKADPEHFLDWDRPLSEQHPKVREAVRSTLRQFADQPEPFPGVRAVEQRLLSAIDTPENVSSASALKGYDAYQHLARRLAGASNGRWNPQDAVGSAAALREAGIPGIRYLDQGSRGAGEGSRNYVAFDPATIEILRKYGLAGLLGGGAAAAAAPGDAQAAPAGLIP
jgi:hypothetical protein